MSLLSGFNRPSTVPAGNAAKAAFVGAKIVKGPVPLRVSTRPAAVTAVTRVVWSADPTAISTTVLDGASSTTSVVESTAVSSVVSSLGALQLAKLVAAKPKRAKVTSLKFFIGIVFKCLQIPNSET